MQEKKTVKVQHGIPTGHSIYAEPDVQSALGAWARQLRNLDSADCELMSSAGDQIEGTKHL